MILADYSYTSIQPAITHQLPHYFPVAVVICFFLCWSPYHAQRLLFSYLTLTGRWNGVLVKVHHYLYWSSGMVTYRNLLDLYLKQLSQGLRGVVAFCISIDLLFCTEY